MHDRRGVTLLVRNALWRRVRLISFDDARALGELDAEWGWRETRWRQALDSFYDVHEDVLVDDTARRWEYLAIDEKDELSAHVWHVRQTLCDTDGDHDFLINKISRSGAPILRKITPTVEDAGQLQSEDEIRMFIIAFRSMVGTLATLKTFSKFDWADLAVVMDEEEYDGYKSWYLYYKDQTHNPNPKVPVPVDVDFDIELVRTDRINVVYILNLLKNANTHDKTEEEKQQDVDLILREIERSDNESLRLKKEVMRQFILTRFYDLPEDADVMEAFTQFEKEQMKADMEEFAFDNKIDYMIVSELFTEYVFHGTISDDDIRKRLTAYKLGLLKMTKLTKSVKTFVTETYNKYKAEGE